MLFSLKILRKIEEELRINNRLIDEQNSLLRAMYESIKNNSQYTYQIDRRFEGRLAPNVFKDEIEKLIHEIRELKNS